VMGLLAFIAGRTLDVPLRDPDGFLGPSWLRMPLMVLGAFVLDVVPRSLWRARRQPQLFVAEARTIVREHWTGERIRLVVIGLVCFYVTYVSYRNLKNYLPFMGSFNNTRDPVLHSLDKAIFFGTEPAVLLHAVLGESLAAHILAAVYLIFLPFSPLALVAWLVWSRNISFGYWYATAFCLNWALGTASYYALPSLGPNFYYPWLYADLDRTGVTGLQESLYNGRQDVWWDPLSGSIQSVAGFASLHVAVVLTAALVAQYTVRMVWVRWGMWVYFALTVVSTLYFGWHYIADDIGGVAIAVLAVWLGALATGQKFERHGKTSRPTTSTADVPVEPTTV
jgi:membrane-associated phospholipid phosphatase